ncbi:Transcriptional regulatory protein RcsB [compost metagenome]
MRIRVVYADDHPALIAGITHILSGAPTIEVIGTARNSTEIVELLSHTDCDVLVTDYAMPGGRHGDGLAFISFLRRRFPDLKIIVFSAIDSPAVIQAMVDVGVPSVISKAADVGYLLLAIHSVYAGATYFHPELSPDSAAGKPGMAESRPLSKREAEVVRLYASGLSIGEIAARLNRTKQTISSQKAAAMTKLGFERDADLFRYAFETGMVPAAQEGSGA